MEEMRVRRVLWSCLADLVTVSFDCSEDADARKVEGPEDEMVE